MFEEQLKKRSTQKDFGWYRLDMEDLTDILPFLPDDNTIILELVPVSKFQVDVRMRTDHLHFVD